MQDAGELGCEALPDPDAKRCLTYCNLWPNSDQVRCAVLPDSDANRCRTRLSKILTNSIVHQKCKPSLLNLFSAISLPDHSHALLCHCDTLKPPCRSPATIVPSSRHHGTQAAVLQSSANVLPTHMRKIFPTRTEHNIQWRI